VFADRGYFKGEEILDCMQSRITALIPKPQTCTNKAAGLFDKADFHYTPAKDEYRCAANEPFGALGYASHSRLLTYHPSASEEPIDIAEGTEDILDKGRVMRLLIGRESPRGFLVRAADV
jgi:hypothetical protein